MKKCLLTLLFFTICKVKSQPIVTDGNNQQILNWDSSYQIESVRYFGLKNYIPIEYQYTIKKASKTVANYYRHDDSSFLFVSIDSIGRQIQKGILKMFFGSFISDTIQIPDLVNDPNFDKSIFKDTIINSYSYRKEGMWKELDKAGKIWLGIYINGKKEGIWQLGVYFYDPHMPATYAEAMFDNFRPLSKHLFENGQEIAKFSDTAFWPTINGKWYWNSTLDSNTLILQRTAVGKIYLNFEKNNLFSSIRPSSKPIMHSLISYKAHWKQTGDILEIVEDKKTQLLQILSFSKTQMIVRFLKWKN